MKSLNVGLSGSSGWWEWAVASRRLFERRIRQLMTARPATAFIYAAGVTDGAVVEPSTLENYHHTATRHEFAFIVSGRARISTPRATFTLGRGQLLVIEPGVDHVELPVEPPAEYRLCWFVADRSHAVMSHTGYSRAGGWYVGPLMELYGRTNLQSIAAAISAELVNRSWGWDEAARSLLRYLGCVLIRRIRRGRTTRFLPLESPIPVQDAKSWAVVQDTLAYCREHLSQHLRVSEVAEGVGYSPGYLSQLFRFSLGPAAGRPLARAALCTSARVHSRVPNSPSPPSANESDMPTRLISPARSPALSGVLPGRTGRSCGGSERRPDRMGKGELRSTLERGLALPRRPASIQRSSPECDANAPTDRGSGSEESKSRYSDAARSLGGCGSRPRGDAEPVPVGPCCGRTP